MSAGFHQSALIMLPVYFLINQKKINVIKATTIMGAVFILLLTPLSDIIIRWVLNFFPNSYSYYYQQGSQNSLRATLISSFYFFLIVLNINKLNGKELIYGKLSLIATIISLLAYKVSMITRIGMYFDIFLIVTIPLVFSKMKKGKVRVILFTVMFGIYLLRYWSFFHNDIWIDSYKTYQTILNK
ncbi:EpsG family protein [Peribacillus sp. TH24]|uniref:EpsG family protein n=1 Tax=Peribacillus sp. TH24 TaxID=2798483 RepID=UPI0019119989|nr:EpsG family protein [Peribacillus sp. TH24]